jgi:hypothetical protein
MILRVKRGIAKPFRAHYIQTLRIDVALGMLGFFLGIAMFVQPAA